MIAQRLFLEHLSVAAVLMAILLANNIFLYKQKISDHISLNEWNYAFFHTSKDLKIIYDRDTGELEISFKGEPVADDAQYTVGIQEFYYANARHLLDLSSQQLEKLGGRETICKDPFGLQKDYFETHKGLGGRIDDRIIIKGGKKKPISDELKIIEL